MLCSIKVNSNTFELTVYTFCYCILDLLQGLGTFIRTFRYCHRTLPGGSDKNTLPSLFRQCCLITLMSSTKPKKELYYMVQGIGIKLHKALKGLYHSSELLRCEEQLYYEQKVVFTGPQTTCLCQSNMNQIVQISHTQKR